MLGVIALFAILLVALTFRGCAPPADGGGPAAPATGSTSAAETGGSAGGIGDESDGGGVGAGPGATGSAAAAAGNLFEGRAEPTSSAAFLDDLAAAAGAAEAKGSAAVAWTEDSGLVEAAEAVLGAYRNQGNVTLVTSGYLDLAGNVWGALLQGGQSWVDIALVSTEDDAASEVRIVRLLPGEHA